MYKKIINKKIYFLLFFVLIFLFIVNGKLVLANTNETITGYLIDVHCYERESNNPSIDTKKCLLMPACAKCGYGIAFKNEKGTYDFYYFNGDFITDINNFNGTKGQKAAYDIIVNSNRNNNFLVTVSGYVTGEEKPSYSSDSINYKVFNVNSISETYSEKPNESNNEGNNENNNEGNNGNSNEVISENNIETINPSNNSIESNSNNSNSSDNNVKQTNNNNINNNEKKIAVKIKVKIRKIIMKKIKLRKQIRTKKK